MDVVDRPKSAPSSRGQAASGRNPNPNLMLCFSVYYVSQMSIVTSPNADSLVNSGSDTARSWEQSSKMDEPQESAPTGEG